jgi:hypothetical protein
MNSLAEAIQTEQWLVANNESNNLENFVTSASGNIDLDNILYDRDPTTPYATAMINYLNIPGLKLICSC